MCFRCYFRNDKYLGSTRLRSAKLCKEYIICKALYRKLTSGSTRDASDHTSLPGSNNEMRSADSTVSVFLPWAWQFPVRGSAFKQRPHPHCHSPVSPTFLILKAGSGSPAKVVNITVEAFYYPAPPATI